jgi:hypothetical protein
VYLCELCQKTIIWWGNDLPLCVNRPTHRDAYWVPLPNNESPAAYAAVFEEFLRVVLRSSQGHTSTFEIPLTQDQHALAVEVFEALLSGRESVFVEIHKFLWELVRAQPGEGESTIATCPFQRWMAVHALKIDATFIDADAFAQYLAKIKYNIKNIGMVEAHRRQTSHPNGIIG